MQLSTKTRNWSEAELMSLPKVGGKYELVEGELRVTPAGHPHESIVMEIAAEMKLFVKKHRLGRVWASNLGYWMKNGNLRSPDVSFVEESRFRSMTRDSEGFLYGAPDLSVEILSPSNTVKAMEEKAVEYFENGSKIVWIVNPDDQTVLILRPDGSEKVLNVRDILDGEDVIPGFSLVVSELFEDLE